MEIKYARFSRLNHLESGLEIFSVKAFKWHKDDLCMSFLRQKAVVIE